MQPDYKKMLLDNQLEPKQEQLVIQLFKEWSQIWAWSDFDLGCLKTYRYRIDTGDSPPQSRKRYRLSDAENEEISRQLKALLGQGIVRRCESSPWCAPTLLVPKKNGKWRWCIDYRALNSTMKGDQYPLPLIDELLRALQGCAWFSSLDLRAGYWQMAVHPDDIQKTAFSTKEGLFEWTRCPFGLKTMPECFQRAMESVLQGLDFVQIFMDDILVHSPTFESHLEHIKTVFHRLMIAGLKLNPEKCTMFKDHVIYLGHVVSKKGICPDDNKLAVVGAMRAPTTVQQVRSFLGLTGYYRDLIPNYSALVEPLQRLIRSRVKWGWGIEQEKSFRCLKVALTRAPLVAQPNPKGGPYRLTTDWSSLASGAILSQVQGGRERVIAYYSRQNNEAESNYCSAEGEALAIIKAVKKFRPYLFGRHFLLFTDSWAAKYLLNTKEHTGKLCRWAMYLQSFDFTIYHVEGKKNTAADTLSRLIVGEPVWKNLENKKKIQDQVKKAREEGAMFTRAILE